ncbi:MAG: cell envelope integrity protein CreD [Pseudomonadota bacterium]
MFRSSGLRFIAVGVLALIMFIPLSLVSGIIEDRARYSDQAITEISRDWGGAQVMSGPLLVIPVTEEVTYTRHRPLIDPITGEGVLDKDGEARLEFYQETVTERRAPVFVYPSNLDIAFDMVSTTRHRGIFEVPVFTADIEAAFAFDVSSAEAALRNDEVLEWDQARIDVPLSSNRALRGEARLEGRAGALDLEPIAGPEAAQTGITAATGDPRDLGPLTLALSLNGARSIAVVATGRTTRLSITSDWPDPSFYGAFLPDASEIGETGFTAAWTVPHLARSLPRVSRANPDQTARNSATMGVRFITPNDFYQKAYRAARYGILFIGLTFLTILLLDRAGERPVHPVQYLMVGLAQSMFVLLMVAYAEQIGFGAAYLFAAGATVGLLTLFGALALKLGRRTGLLAAMLVTVYGVLYLILRSADFALLAGATLAFIALAGTMLMTRNEDWHGPDREPRRWFKRRDPPPAPS